MKTKGAIAEMLAFYVCASREDLRKGVIDDNWDQWKDLLLDHALDDSPETSAETYREIVKGIVDDSAVQDAFKTISDVISARWNPPCPPIGAIDATFRAVCDYYGIDE